MGKTKCVKCSECGRSIPIGNAYYLNGKPYGYTCYRRNVTLIYKQWEDEKNTEYSAKCFAAMQIFQNKKSNSFHNSVCKQWDDCKKLTAKQLACIEKSFTEKEDTEFCVIWKQLTNDDFTKSSIASRIKHNICDKLSDYIDNDTVLNCICYNCEYKYGFHIVRDIDDDPEIIYIMRNGKDNSQLKEDIEDEYLEVLKIVNNVKSI